MADENSIAPSELNPRPTRVIQTMGDISLSDWLWFGAFLIISVILLFAVPFPTFGLSGIFIYVIKMVWISPFLIFGCCMAFLQSRTNGKFRWRVVRNIKFNFKRKYISPLEMTQLYAIKETRDNHVHYRESTNEGVLSFYRIEGFDPSLLSNAQIQGIIENLTSFFSANLRFKIVSSRIAYTIPAKKMALEDDHYGLNFARNRYVQRIKELNESEDLRQQAYFIVVDGQSIDKNTETISVLSSPLTDAHLKLRSATEQEISQVFNELWCGGFNISEPNKKIIKNISYDSSIVKFSKLDGTHEYVSFQTFNSLPEQATLGWLGSTFNSDNFSLIMDISPMSPTESSKYMEHMDAVADSIMTTKWFRKRASDTERLKIRHIKDIAQNVTVSIANGQTAMKEVCFYLIFKAKTRKALKKKIDEYNKSITAFSNGWTIFNCKYLQRDALTNTRLYDIPSLQYHSKAFKTFGFGKNHSTRNISSISSINNTDLISAIDHKILTTSLGLSYPFYSRASVADENTWFKGFQIDQATGDMDPFFNDYWKKNEQYNSFNRFYQGRNGSGKSYTADIDIVSDRLDNKFIISIDPKPERDIMTKNLGGQNLLIGSNQPGAAYINIFDVLITPSSENNQRQNPLLSQYQANLTSMSILLSLDTENPNDKIVLSCFNDVQIYVYEKIKKISPTSDFFKFPKNKYPLMVDFYNEAIRRYNSEHNSETKTAFSKLLILMKEHAIGISAPLFNNYTNINWGASRMWNLIVRDIALNYGNKNILAVWTINIIRVASAFLYANEKVVLYIDELHLIHNISGVLARLDEFARVDRSFGGALCLINQNFNSIRAGGDPKKTEYYESIFTMSQYNMFFTTGEEDVLFLVDMLEGSGSPLSQSERSFITRAGRGKALLVMNAYDRYRVEFDISFWREIWEQDLESIYKQQMVEESQQEQNIQQTVVNERANQQPFIPTPLPGVEKITKKILAAATAHHPIVHHETHEVHKHVHTPIKKKKGVKK